ncbi:ARPP-1 family domain-containing protein [uncultured Methanobrevibacter sp.]|uniref:ARPP-1 family domain-containing protein n=1 Tax=uncultured Methanobrevibacter sp. TaxID=253161 RepID=UPI0026228333|nr:DUF6569 family protein [uncultured Methanobrevibacter sp.]
MISALKSEIEFLDSQVHKNMAIIPIKTPINYNIDILTLKKGFELGLVEVKECEKPQVNTLIVVNNSVSPLLLVDGEEIIGGDQNRIVNATVIIDAQSEMHIPVNCTEHGRWGYKHEFKPSEYILNSRTRFAKTHARRSNRDVQTEVWNSIDRLESLHNVSSKTQAMSETYERKKTDLNELVKSFEICKGQTGVVIIIDGEVKGFEIFFNAEIYAEYHEKILKSYLIDAEIKDSAFTVNVDTAREIISKACESEFSEVGSTGLEKSFEFKNEEGLGNLYSFKDEIIHVSYMIGDEKEFGMDEAHPNSGRADFIV